MKFSNEQAYALAAPYTTDAHSVWDVLDESDPSDMTPWKTVAEVKSGDITPRQNRSFFNGIVRWGRLTQEQSQWFARAMSQQRGTRGVIAPPHSLAIARCNPEGVITIHHFGSAVIHRVQFQGEGRDKLAAVVWEVGQTKDLTVQT